MTKSPRLDLRHPFCVLCGAPLEFVKTHGGYWACSNLECGIEVWNTSAPKRRVSTWEAQQILQAEQQDKNLMIKKRGNKPAGRKRDKKQRAERIPPYLPE